MDADTLNKIAIAARAAADKKAFDVVGLDVGELTSYTDGFLLCSAASDRQVGAVVEEIGRRLKHAGAHILHSEGATRSDWVLLDFGDLVVHVFTEERRAFYALDNLWRDAPRLDEAALGLDDPAPSTPS
ncbi:MAG: ribosome silencing factor [Holophagae bacterium]